MSVPTWIVRFEGKVSLIDTGAGNDKDRPTLKVLDHLHNPYLERLAAIGVQPETVDYILLTHIHADHAARSITSQGSEAIFGGDAMHHPIELYEPDLVSMFCEFPKGQGVHGAGWRATPQRGMRCTSAVISRPRRLAGSPRRGRKTSAGSLWISQGRRFCRRHAEAVLRSSRSVQGEAV
jgi:hypothetical protein